MTRTVSLARSRSSSAITSPWKFGWLNPSTMSCTGPIAMLHSPLFVCLHDASGGPVAHHPEGSRRDSLGSLSRPNGGPMQTLLPGITAERVPTRRLTMAVLSVTGRTGHPVLFVHGNVSSSLFWQPTLLAMPEGFQPLAVFLRGFGATDPEPVDAT